MLVPGVLYNYIYPKLFFSIRGVSITHRGLFSSPNPPSNHNTSQVGRIRVKFERAGVWTINRLID